MSNGIVDVERAMRGGEDPAFGDEGARAIGLKDHSRIA